MNFETYIGTKRIEATPMSREDYNEYRGWTIPTDKTPTDEGYLVKYSDDYISWSPKKAFEDAYRKSGEMNFGHAIEMLKAGYKVARSGWNGKGMWLRLIIPEIADIDMGYDNLPYIEMKTADNKLVPWLASQTDMLAEDWTILE